MNFQGGPARKGGEGLGRPMKFINISQFILQLQPNADSWFI